MDPVETALPPVQLHVYVSSLDRVCVCLRPGRGALHAVTLRAR